MFTEEWPDNFDLPRPPPFPGTIGDRPLVVHLDQWCWDRIARDRAGVSRDQPDTGIHGFLLEKAVAGDVVFPLSQAHYRENWSRTNDDARWDTSVVMAELSGFNTISNDGVAEWEALLAASWLFDREVDPVRPDVFGWGIGHCFSGMDTGAQIDRAMEVISTALGGNESNTREQLAGIRLNLAHRLELALLARRDPRLERARLIEPYPPVDDAKGESFRQQQLQLRKHLGTSPTALAVRNQIEVLSFIDSEPLLARAAVKLGLPSHSIASAVERGEKSAVHDLLQQMPVQRVFTEMRVQAHLKDSFGWRSSDCVDFLALACTAPFVDGLVVDQKTFHLAHDAGVGLRLALGIFRALADLRVTLEHLFGG